MASCGERDDISIAHRGERDQSPPEAKKNVSKVQLPCVGGMAPQQLPVEKERAKEECLKGQNHQQDANLSEDRLEGVAQNSEDQWRFYQLGYLQEFEEIDNANKAQPQPQAWHPLNLPSHKEFDINWKEGEEVNHVQGILEEQLLVWAETKSHRELKSKPEDTEKLQMKQVGSLVVKVFMAVVRGFRIANRGGVGSKELKLCLGLLTEYDDNSNDEQQRNKRHALQREEKAHVQLVQQTSITGPHCPTTTPAPLPRAHYDPRIIFLKSPCFAHMECTFSFQT